MQTLQVIDTLTDEVLTEMLELISLDYDNNFYESLADILYDDLLMEALTPQEIRNQQRQQRVRTAALRAANSPTSRSTKRYNTQQTTNQITQSMKGKYDRRPWYRKAFSGLKNWVKGKLNSDNGSSAETSNEPVAYVRSRTSSKPVTGNITQSTVSNTSQTNNTPPVKIKSKNQDLATKIRNDRQKTRQKQLTTFNKFREKSQAAKFKQMPKPLSPSALANKTSSNSNSSQTSNNTSAPSYPLGALSGNNATQTRSRVRPPSLSSTMRPEE